MSGCISFLYTKMKFFRFLLIAVITLCFCGASAKTQSLFDKGLDKYSNGDYQAAVDSYTIFIQANPENYVAIYNRGLAYYSLHNMEKAYADFKAVYVVEGSNAELVDYLCDCAYQLGEYEDAKAFLKESIAVDSLRSAPWVTLGVIYFDEKSYEDCIAAENQAILIDPNDEKGYYNLALAYHALKQYDLASANLDKCIALDPKDGAAWTVYGEVLYARDMPKEAMQKYEKAIALDPTDPVALNNLGKIYLENSDAVNACKYMKQAALLDTEDALYSLNYGKALRTKGDYKEAIIWDTKAINIDNKDADGYIERGSCYSELKDYDHALQDYKDAYDLQPSIELKNTIAQTEMNQFFNKQLIYILLFALLAIGLILSIIIFLVRRRDKVA